MPVIPEGDWERRYLEFVQDLLGKVPLQRLTLGGISMDLRTQLLLERRIGADNVISRKLSRRCCGESDKAHYPFSLCKTLFRQIADMAYKAQPGLSVEVAIP